MSAPDAGEFILSNQSYNDTFLNMSARGQSMEQACRPVNIQVVNLLLQILYSLICVVGILGNTLVIYVVLRFSKMQTVTNTYIVNLALADEFFLVGVPFLVTTMSLNVWVFGKVMCKIFMASTSVTQFTSSIFLLIMSADRYIAVCHPISSPKLRTPMISKVISLTAWLTSAVFMIPIFLYANTLETDKGMTCTILWPETEGDRETSKAQTYFTIYSFVLGFGIPLVLILIFYALVIRKLRTVGPKNKSKEKKRSHRKVTKLVLTVITVYIVCWFPYWLTQMALVTTNPNECQSRITVTMFLLAGFLSYSNSAMNPILYAFLSDNFKKSFLKACTCAAGKDVNATLHVENSVFPRRNKANVERLQSNKLVTSGNSKNDAEDEENERGLLISKTSTTTMTMTSRSNIPSDNQQKDKDPTKNGTQLTQL